MPWSLPRCQFTSVQSCDPRLSYMSLLCPRPWFSYFLSHSHIPYVLLVIYFLLFFQCWRFTPLVLLLPCFQASSSHSLA